ncbi:MAG: hypothetical protein PUF10_02720 [Bacteroidales bacterium]|nr:hypothetical protein [Bacteroidales bacterium]
MKNLEEFEGEIRQFNKHVKSISERIRQSMDALGLKELGDYAIKKVKYEECTSRYLALKVKGQYSTRFKSLEEEKSQYYLFSSDEWIEAADVYEKIAFCKKVPDILEVLQAKKDAMASDMQAAVKVAEDALNGAAEIELCPACENPVSLQPAEMK